MCKGSAEYKAGNGDCGVGIAFAGKDQLTEGAAAQKHGTPAYDAHAEEVHDAVVMGDRLIGKAKVELVEDQVADEDGNYDRHEAEGEAPLVEHDGIAYAACHAETAALCQNTYYDTGCKSEYYGGVHGAGALGALGKQGRGEAGQHQQDDHQYRHPGAVDAGLSVVALEGEALLEGYGTYKDASDKAHKADNGVQVAAAYADDHAQGAAQEYQSAYHYADGQNEAGEGGRTADGLPFLLDEGGSGSAGDDAHDLRAHILYDSGGMKLKGAGYIAQEAGDAEAHVGRVAEGCEHQRRDTDDYAGKQYGKILFHNK